MRNNTMKEYIAEHAVATALLAGVAVFLLANYVISGLAGWPPLVGAAGGAVAFVGTLIGVYVLTRNIVDAYTLQVAPKEEAVYGLLHEIEANLKQIQNRNTVAVLQRICKHSRDLVIRTRKSQPANLLSAVTVLENWLKMVRDLDQQYVDVQDHPEYQDNPEGRMTKANTALESFDLFLLNSIKTIEKGDQVQFDVATSMLDSTKFNIV
jgi:hypothetical protein